MVTEDDFAFAEDWSNAEWNMYDDVLGGEPEIMADQHLADLYHAALFDLSENYDQRLNDYKDLVDYLWEEWEIDFDGDFDWEAYREWYG